VGRQQCRDLVHLGNEKNLRLCDCSFQAARILSRVEDALDLVAQQRVSVIVCSYADDRIELLAECLHSLQVQARRPDEILLVIDHNQALLRKAKRRFPGIKIVENVRSRGCSGARNCGADNATGEIITFLDDDAWADPMWLAELTLPFEDESVLGTAGLILPQWSDQRPPWFPPEFDWVVGCSYLGLPERTAPVRNLWGTMSFRRRVFEEVGGFNESMGRVGSTPLGCEDTDFSIRVRAKYPDAELLYVKQALVSHHIESFRTTRKYFFRRCYAEGLSKALVTQSVGASSGLETERMYVGRVLPRGVARGLRDTFLTDLGGLQRATMITLGLGTTIAGYLRGRLARSPEIAD
jgi:GT2 family glycosyltransferase